AALRHRSAMFSTQSNSRYPLLEMLPLQPLQDRHRAGTVITHQYHIAARIKSGLGTFRKGSRHGRTGHAEIIRENHPSIAAFIAQHLPQPIAGETRWLRIDGGVAH